MAIIQKTIQTAKFKYWKGIIEDRIQSGLSIDEYCKKNSLSRNAYFYWLRKVRTYIIEQGTSGCLMMQLDLNIFTFVQGTQI